MGVLFFFIWLVMWLLPMIVSGTLASRAERSVALWVILSFFFGWIPTLILLAINGF